MDLLKDLKMPLLNFRFIMIYTVQEILLLIKNNLNYLKDNIFECFFREYKMLLTVLNCFFIIYNNGKFKY